jgi:hypothetical protein
MIIDCMLRGTSLLSTEKNVEGRVWKINHAIRYGPAGEWRVESREKTPS